MSLRFLYYYFTPVYSSLAKKFDGHCCLFTIITFLPITFVKNRICLTGLLGISPLFLFYYLVYDHQIHKISNHLLSLLIFLSPFSFLLPFLLIFPLFLFFLFFLSSSLMKNAQNPISTTNNEDSRVINIPANFQLNRTTNAR